LSRDTDKKLNLFNRESGRFSSNMGQKELGNHTVYADHVEIFILGISSHLDEVSFTGLMARLIRLSQFQCFIR
jgi:hypothetical protein